MKMTSGASVTTRIRRREQVMEGKQGYNKNQKERGQVKEGKQY